MNGNRAIRKVAVIGTVVASMLALAACETATPYQPLAPHAKTSGGYSDQQIEGNRYRVTFAGNGMTSRETVETYLLYRAAELTLAKGYDWFQMAQRHTDKKSNTYVDGPIGGPGYWGGWGPGWGPGWRYHGAFGWRGWDPYWGDPFWGDNIDVTTVDRFEASAEIVMGHGPKPADNDRAFDAHSVVANLQAKIVPPKP